MIPLKIESIVVALFTVSMQDDFKHMVGTLTFLSLNEKGDEQ